MKQAIVLQTHNSTKLREWSDTIQKFRVIQDSFASGRPDDYSDKDKARIYDLLIEGIDGQTVVAVVREQTNIFADPKDAHPIPQLEDGMQAVDRTRMEIWELTDGQLTMRIVQESVNGRIDLSKNTSKDAAFAWKWDHVFVPDGGSESYHETKYTEGRKPSARQRILDAWLKNDQGTDQGCEQKSRPVLGTYQLKGKPFQLASDLHWGLEGQHGLSAEQAIADLAERIIHEKREDCLFLLGDLFEGARKDHSPLDTSEAINALLDRIHPHFKHILFTPGNHDLRRIPLTEDPWKDFILPRNVIMPYGTEPRIEEIDGVQILIGNLGYSMELIPPQILEIPIERVLDYYSKTPDGKGFLRGRESIGVFREMGRNLASKITPSVDAVVTHVLPHPCLVDFKVLTAQEAVSLSKKYGLDFRATNSRDEFYAKKWGKSLAEYAEAYNLKSLLMGDNLLDPVKGADPREGITFVYGHNHRGGERIHVINDLPVRFITHQRHQGEVMYQPGHSV